jgi:integrase
VTDSSEAFTPDEVVLILEEANGLGQDAYHLVEFLLHFGIHPSLVQKLEGDDIRKKRLDGRDVFSLPWHRTKTGEYIDFPVMAEDMLWLPDFLNRTPFGSRWSIDRQLARIQNRLEKRGYSVNVCARRFRHTCAVLLLQRGIAEVMIRRLLGVTAETLETYGKYRFETVYKELQDSAWSSGGPPLHSPQGL